MITWVALYLADPSSRGTYADYDRFARETDGAPGAQTVRNEVGPWATIKAEALRMLAGAPAPSVTGLHAPDSMRPRGSTLSWDEPLPVRAA